MAVDTTQLKKDLDTTKVVTKENVGTIELTTSLRVALLRTYQVVDSGKSSLANLLRDIGLAEALEEDVECLRSALHTVDLIKTSHQSLRRSGLYTSAEVLNVLVSLPAKKCVHRLRADKAKKIPGLSDQLLQKIARGLHREDHPCGLNQGQAQRALLVDRLYGQIECRDALQEVLKPRIDPDTYQRLKNCVDNKNGTTVDVEFAKTVYITPIQAPEVIEAEEMLDFGEQDAIDMYLSAVLQHVRVKKEDTK